MEVWSVIDHDMTNHYLSFKSRHKAVGQNVVPHTKSEEKKLSNVWIFNKVS